MKNQKLPELLAPAGSFDAFLAALSAGADAVYLGGLKHNARVNAKNFNDEELKKAFDLAGVYQKKIYVTLNTLVSDRELQEVLSYVDDLRRLGADAFIVQDLGLMSAIKYAFPDVTLHASTQCVTHSLDQINKLKELGAKRVVVARELDRDNLRFLCKESPLEIEAFVHGALCVCHSGACLFSSLVGGRSGNRGECAQPCRLPYSFSGLNMDFPLSLSDLSLSEYVKELIEMGVASFKIEGRMKSPEYVGGAVSVFRRLIDETRGVDSYEKEHLARLFSRNGFTHGYFDKSLGKEMYGVRREKDKNDTRALEKKDYTLPKIKISASLSINAEGGALVMEKDGKRAEAKLPPPTIAENRPIDRAFALSQIEKLGSTPFELDLFEFSSDGDYIYPRSVINEARREAAEGLTSAIKFRGEAQERRKLYDVTEASPDKVEAYVIFAPHRRATKSEVERLLSLVDRVYLPIFRMPLLDSYEGVGVLLPTILKDSERGEVEAELKRLYALGVRKTYSENVGGAVMAKELGFDVLGGQRLNIYNSYTVKALKDMGLEGGILSPELSPSQKRDIKKAMPLGEVVWGRTPLMICENCLMNLRDGCRESSDHKGCNKKGVLTDRRGVDFPVYPEFFHRCQIFNSVPTYNADKPVTKGVAFRVIFITDENNSVATTESIIKGERITDEFTRK